MPTYVNCSPGDTLGYPGYFRAVYAKKYGPTGQLSHVIAGIVGKMNDPDRNGLLATPVGDPVGAIGPDASTATIDFDVLADGDGVTVAQLSNAVNPAISWLPDLLSEVTLRSLTRIGRDDAYGVNAEGSRANAAAVQAANETGIGDVLRSLETDLKWVVVAVVVLAVAYAIYKFAPDRRAHAA